MGGSGDGAGAPGGGRTGSRKAEGSSGWLRVGCPCGPFNVGDAFMVKCLALELGLLRLGSDSPLVQLKMKVLVQAVSQGMFSKEREIKAG